MTPPRGITGFDGPRGLVPPAPRLFRGDLLAAVARHGGTVADALGLAGVLTSFTAARVESAGWSGAALLHAVHPWAAFVPADGVRFGGMAFVDPPARLAAALAAAGRWVLPPADWLNAPATDEMLADLGPAERHQLRYWTRRGGGRSEPITVGNVAFNFWD